ncbi:cell wall-binding repeat-containing protein [Alteribacter lacisalsi]|nr:cell wall-binding repeat-containing protein [Alteribacter lacisalsi]
MKFTRSMAVFMSFLIVFSAFSSTISAAPASGPTDSVSWSDENRESAEVTVDAEVTTTFATEEYVDVLIEFESQVDTGQVAADAAANLDANTSKHEETKTKRAAVVRELQANADRTQQQVVSYLDSQLEEGSVQEFTSYYIMNVVSATVTEDVLEDLASYPEIRTVKLDQEIHVEFPEKSEEYEIETSSDGVEWNIDAVNAPQVWNEFGLDGTGVVIGMIDTGIDWSHEALMHQWRGYDANDPENPNPEGNWFDAINGEQMPVEDPVNPHGTHVMGTMLGQDLSGNNKIGVAPNAEWITARALTNDGGMQSWLLAAGEFMLAPNGDPELAPDIVNNSWGGSSDLDEWYRPMVNAWRDAGIFPVFAAGNTPGQSEPGSISTPSNYPESYAVGATDIDNIRGGFSNQGPGPYDDNLKPDIAAPGVNIRSAVPGGYQGGWNGTSMAAPNVAGIAALLLSMDASLTPDDLEEVLNNSVTPLTDDQYPESPNNGYGRGLVDAYEAVLAISDGHSSVEGYVLKEGEDTNAPEISHDPITAAYEGIDLPIYADVEDDVAITSVRLLVSVPHLEYDLVIPMEQESGNHREGAFRTEIPADYITGEGFSYSIEANDFGNNVTETEVTDVDVRFGIKPDEYATDFSEQPVGWIFEGDWAWDEPTLGPEPEAGDRVIATNPHGVYDPRDDRMLVAPPIDLREADEASLRFHHWYSTPATVLPYDYSELYVSTDYGDTWDRQGTFFAGQSDGWEGYYLDLNDFTGSEEPVLVGFRHHSGNANNAQYEGWYLDDVELVGVDTTPPGEPVNLEASAKTDGVTVSWNAPEDLDVEKYQVHRALEGEDFEEIGETGDRSFTDPDIEGQTVYEYKVKAIDFAGNESGFSETLTVVTPVIEPVYYENFDQDDGGFATGGNNNSWEWGEPTYGPNEAEAGDNLWGTNLDGVYNADEQSWIESPVIDLTEAASAEMTFSHWRDHTLFHNGQVLVSIDEGESWEQIAEYGARIRAWEETTLRLDEFAGEEIQLRFLNNGSPFISPEAGWYIDELTVVGSFETEASTAAASHGETAVVQADEKSEDIYEVPVTFTLNSDSHHYYTSEDDISEEVTGLPLAATLTVEETGRTVRTDPADGSYTLIHAASEDGEPYTLTVESYGFYSETIELELEPDTVKQQSFVLDPVPTGEASGEVTDQRTGEPVEGASVSLAEDSRVSADTTDDTGTFTLEDVLEGSYTVLVTHPDYHSGEAEVEVTGGEVSNVSVELRPFIGFNGEIAYDDGSAENARAFYNAGAGWGMRMTPQAEARVDGVSVYLWGTDWPVPGSDDFAVAVFDSVPGGGAGNMVIGPVEVEGERGGWNYVDLSEYSFTTDRDFYVVMIQTGSNPNAPGMGMDESGPFAERSYTYANGSFEQLDEEYGNIMIRSDVTYALNAPSWDQEDTIYTNEDTVEVSGTTNADGPVTIYNGDQTAAETEAVDRTFSAEVELTEGTNELTAVSVSEDGDSDPSSVLTVVKDVTAPEITITAPEEGMVTKRDSVTVTGEAADDNLAYVSVNGTETQVEDDGTFSETLLLAEEGEHTITVEAADLAGNTAAAERTVVKNTSVPEIAGLEPSEDMTVIAGDTVQVSFESDVYGGEAVFSVKLPIGSNNSEGLSKDMTETAPGGYEGSWTVPEGLVIDEARVEVTITDQAGNTASQVAAGSITVTEAQESMIDRIYGENRYETAAAISQAGWEEADTVLLARGDDFADALSAAPLAYQYDAPVLLTSSDYLRDVTAEEITRLGAENVIILGGENAVSENVEQSLVDLGLAVERIAGENRYETAAAIAGELDGTSGEPALLVNGLDFADSVSSASHAAQNGYPVLLTNGEQLHEATAGALNDLSIEEVLVIGGENAISDEVFGQLPDPYRIYGDNRYETSVAVAEYFGSTNRLFIATGREFPDALSGAVLAAGYQTGILLTGDEPAASAEAYILNNGIDHLSILGGTNAVSEHTEEQLKVLLP